VILSTRLIVIASFVKTLEAMGGCYFCFSQKFDRFLALSFSLATAQVMLAANRDPINLQHAFLNN
jgi:hypothetical protein